MVSRIFPATVEHSSACATTRLDPGLQHVDLDIYLDLDVSVGEPADEHADAGGRRCRRAPADPDPDSAPPNPPSPTPPTPHPLLRTSDAHHHPDGPMLGFLIPEYDAGVDPERDMDMDFDSLSAAGSGGDEGRVHSCVGNALGALQHRHGR